MNFIYRTGRESQIRLIQWEILTQFSGLEIELRSKIFAEKWFDDSNIKTLPKAALLHCDSASCCNTIARVLHCNSRVYCATGALAH